jgi:hypothetical protein
MSGNAVPNWTDDAGSVSRRLLIFQFDRKVVHVNTELRKRIRATVGTALVKCNKAYLAMVSMFGRRGIWNRGEGVGEQPLPEYFHKQRTSLQMATNGLTAFLSSTMVTLGASLYCPKSNFIDAFNKFCASHHYDVAKFQRDFYYAIFEAFGLSEQRTQLPYPRNDAGGNVQDDEYIFGVDLTMSMTPVEQSMSTLFKQFLKEQQGYLVYGTHLFVPLEHVVQRFREWAVSINVGNAVPDQMPVGAIEAALPVKELTCARQKRKRTYPPDSQHKVSARFVMGCDLAPQ